MGAHISSVAPGKTVDSYITVVPTLSILPMVLLALIRGFKSGI